MEFWSQLTGDETETADLLSPSTVHDPPEFLNTRKNEPTRSGSGSASATGEATPLEAQLKTIVVDVCSDKKKNTALFRRKTNSQSEESVKTQLSNGSLPSTPVLGFNQHPIRHSVQFEEDNSGGLVRSGPEGSESPAVSINLNRTQVISDSEPLASPEDLSAGINVLVKALHQRQVTGTHRSATNTNSHSERQFKDSVSSTAVKQDLIPMNTKPLMDQSVSGTQSLGSNPVFSADDLELNEEANSPPLQPLSRMQYMDSLAGRNAATPMQQRPSVLPPLSDSLLYSFSDLSSNSVSSNKESKPPALTDSFGISPQLYQSAMAKPRAKILHSPRSPSASGQFDQRISPNGPSQMTSHSSDHPSSPHVANQVAPSRTSNPVSPPLASNQVSPPLASNQATPPLASNQAVPPLASNQGTPPFASNQEAPPLVSNQVTPPSFSDHEVPTLSIPTSLRALDEASSKVSNGTAYPIDPAIVTSKASSLAAPGTANPVLHNQPGIPGSSTVVDNGGGAGSMGGVAGDKTRASVGGSSSNERQNPVTATLLPLEEQDAGNASREATPTPQSAPVHEAFVPQTNGSESKANCDHQPIVRLGLTQGNVEVRDNGHVSAECGSEVTDSDGHQSSQEDGVQYLAGLDSDAAETGSVVSVQQLAEDYLNVEPADFENVPLPAEGQSRAPLRLPAAANSPKSKSSVNPSSKPIVKDFPSPVVRGDQTQSPSKVPAHISASYQPVERKSDIPLVVQTPSVSSDISKHTLTNERTRTNSIGDHSSDREKDLEGQLAEERRARIHLEGQLESLSEEYEMALADHSDLLNKLGRSKAMLDEMTGALQREKQSNVRLAAQVGVEHPQAVTMSASPHGSEDLVREKEEANWNLQSRLFKEKQKSDKLEKELEDARQALDQAENSLGELQDKIRCSQAELQRQADESEERLCKLSALEASYSALEKNKQWLHEQLQEGLKGKLKLQEEVREAKASSIAQAIKTDQVLQENALLQQQVSDLQKGVLLDKEKLVSQLEEIEAGVLSREDLCSNLVAEKSQLEDMMRLKDKMVSKLNADLGRAQVEKGELQEQVDQVCQDRTELARKAGDLEKEGKNLSKKAKDLAHSLELKESECNELENAKFSLQERLRQADVECVSRDGIIQTLNEAKDMLQRELDLVNESKEGVEKELEDTKCEVVKFEAEVRAALDKCSEKDLLLQSSVEASEGGHKEVMHALLSAKDEEIRGKEAAIKYLEEQVGELVKEFATLQSDVHAQSGSVNDSIAEKDRVIAHLSSLKERSEQELESLKEENDKFQKRLSQLQHEKARLQGQVEGSVQPGDYQKALQDKAEIQATLNTEKLKHQQDQLKSQAKMNRLEKEVRESQKTSSNLQSDLKRTQDKIKEDVDKLKDDNSRLLTKLKETEEKLRRAQVERELPHGVQDSSKHSGDYISALRAKCDELRRENQALARSLEEEVEQRREVERASGLVASQLKQNFEKEKKELQEKNREQSFDLERLQGKLVGLQTTQATLREHTSNLEVSLAGKEADVVRLSGKVQRLTEEKEVDGQELKAQIAALDGKLKEKQEEVTVCRLEIQEEKKKVEKLEREVERLEAEIAAKKAELSRLNVEDAPRLKEQVTKLSLEKETFQSELSYLKSQLLIAKTSADSARREINDKVSQIEILERQLAIAESRYQQASDDVKKLKEHMRNSDRLQAAGYLDSLKGGRDGGVWGDTGPRHWRRRDRGSGSDQPLDTSLSSGTEEADQSSLNQSGQ